MRRLQARGANPVAHMRGGLRLPGAPEQQLARGARRKFLRGSAEANGFFGEPLFKGLDVLERASALWHGAAPCSSVAGAQPAFSSQMQATGRAVTSNGALESGRPRVLCLAGE